MNKQKRWISLGIAAVVAIGAIIGVGAWRGRTVPPEKTEQPAEGTSSHVIEFDEESAKLAGIKLTEVKLGKLKTSIAFNGQIAAAPNAVAQIGSLVSGRVTQLMVSEGDAVKTGQTLAFVESRAIGEAQSAYTQAVASFENAKTHLSVVQKQVQAGVFSRGPVEAARRADAEAIEIERKSETALRQAKVELENVQRQIKAGTFASPALEAAKSACNSAKQALAAAEADFNRSQNQLESAKAELNRRQQLAAAGSYGQKPVEEARRAFISAQSQLSSARSELNSARANHQRSKVLLSEGLISQRDADSAKLAYEQAQSRLEAAESEVSASKQSWEREKKLASTSVAGTAEVNAAKSQLADAEAATATRRAEMQRASDALKLAETALQREQVIYSQSIANRKKSATAKANLEQVLATLANARQQKVLSSAALARELRISKENLNNISQLQSAESEYRGAKANLKSARTALSLLKSQPGGKASIPIRAPIGGVVNERKVTLGQLVTAEEKLMQIVNLEKVALEAAIYEKDISRIRIGAPVTVRVDALQNHVFTGKITFLGSELDAETRTMTARALIRNSGVLRPGMFARGEISTASGQSAITVPANAVQTDGDNKIVYVATETANEFEPREVEVGAKARGLVEIKSGLQPGDKIVNEGAFVVKSEAMKSELAED